MGNSRGLIIPIHHVWLVTGSGISGTTEGELTCLRFGFSSLRSDLAAKSLLGWVVPEPSAGTTWC